MFDDKGMGELITLCVARRTLDGAEHHITASAMRRACRVITIREGE